MNHVKQLLDLVGPQSEEPKDLGPANRRMLAVLGLVGALPLAALWGIAAGSRPGHVALDNAFDVPLLVVISILAALPIGLFTFRLSTKSARVTEFLLAHSSALFASAAMLALLSPIVCLYQYSSPWAGPIVAVASAIAGGVVALVILFRVLAKLLPDPEARRTIALPVFLLLFLEAASLAQVSSVLSPVFSERTVFGRGVDAAHVHHDGESHR